MLLQYLPAPTLVVIAGGIQVFSFLLVNQTHLRLSMLCSTSLYIAYYFTVSDTPLWEAIITSSLTIISILIGLAVLYARNARWMIPKAHADIYPLFDSLLPGDFRKLVKHAKRRTIVQEIVVTRQDTLPDHMYFVVAGTFMAQKGTASFTGDRPDVCWRSGLFVEPAQCRHHNISSRRGSVGMVTDGYCPIHEQVAPLETRA